MDYTDETAENCCIGKLPLERLSNTRDLGGYRTMDGRYILPGRLLRSGTLFDAAPDDLRLLAEEYRLGTVIDFRTPAEQRQKPDPILTGVVYFSNPILDEQAVGITFEEEEPKEGENVFASLMQHANSLGSNPEQYIDRLYQNLILSESAAIRYGTFFDLLLEADDRAVLWHCTAGKDRVGIGTALLLTALGLDRETVVKDYELTNTYVGERAEAVAAMVLDKSGDRKLADCMKVLLTVEPCYLTDALAAAEQQFGSLERYLEVQIGLSDGKKDRLREKYLSPVSLKTDRQEAAGEKQR